MPTPTTGHLDRGRAESFGAVAQRYDRARPTYPPELIDDLAALRPARVLDVGAGTGIATRLLAARGMDVLALEIDARMAGVARAHGSRVEVGSFEEWDDAGRRFDLITSGQAWHWIDPQAGAAKAAAILNPGGVLAPFWNYIDLDPAARDAMDAVYADLAPEIVDSGAIRGSGAATVSRHGAQFEASGRFASVDSREYHWDHRYSRDEWLEMVQTHSDHLSLPGERLDAVLAALGAAIDAQGGSVLAHYGTYAVLARVPG